MLFCVAVLAVVMAQALFSSSPKSHTDAVRTQTHTCVYANILPLHGPGPVRVLCAYACEAQATDS